MGILDWLRPKKPTFNEKEYLELKRRAAKAASVDGKHYTAHVETIKQLKREKRYEEAERLLRRLDAAAEAETKIMGWPAKPDWYAEQLGIVQRHQQRQMKRAKG